MKKPKIIQTTATDPTDGPATPPADQPAALAKNTTQDQPLEQPPEVLRRWARDAFVNGVNAEGVPPTFGRAIVLGFIDAVDLVGGAKDAPPETRAFMKQIRALFSADTGD